MISLALDDQTVSLLGQPLNEETKNNEKYNRANAVQDYAVDNAVCVPFYKQLAFLCKHLCPVSLLLFPYRKFVICDLYKGKSPLHLLCVFWKS